MAFLPEDIVTPLLYWYSGAARVLPWREEPTPYHVWISEIMLQQTRVEAVKDYYTRFLEVLPDPAALAKIDDDALNKLWQGLGYYSRARNLKRAATVIKEKYGGELPSTYAELRALPGIGAYTAGAISSIAFGLPEPAVDGNVLRVITRLTRDGRDITKQTTKDGITQALREIYPRGADASMLTQALMELGAVVCVPNGAPHCGECPLRDLCVSHRAGEEELYPVKAPKKERKIVERTVFLLYCDGKYAIRRRPETGLLSGLWEFPAEDAFFTADEAEKWVSEQGMTLADKPLELPSAKHIFTHIEWRMRGYFLPVSVCTENFVRATPKELAEVYCIPSAFKAFLLYIYKKGEDLS